MQLHHDAGLSWLTFDLLDNCSLSHGVFLRVGGCSQGAFSSLNFSLNLGDLPEHVLRNRKRAQEALGIQQLCALSQIHSLRVVEADSPYLQGDALITNQPGLGLLIQHADCQAALFYDPVHKAIANVHCGWRGSVLNIYRETILKLCKCYGSKPENLLVGISPSLGPQAAEFRHYLKELPATFWDFQVKEAYFDFWEISRWQLQECGILPHHIEVAGMCTFADTLRFFSYRREKICGRNGTIIALP